MRNRKYRTRRLLALALINFMAGAAAAAVVPGQIDDFEDGTVQGWAEGASPNPPVNVADGGPAGAGDNYLSNTSSGGGGSGGKMVMFNSVQWTGDYIAAGITEIHMQVKVFAGGPAYIRAAFESGFGEWYVSTDAVSVANDGAWHDVVLPIDASGLSQFEGAATYEELMSAVTSVRLLSSLLLDRRGDPVAMTIGVDNIEAVAPPTPVLPLHVALPDINSDGIEDIALVRQGSILAEIRSGSNGALQRTIEFFTEFPATTVGAAALPDSDSSGAAELAILATRDTDGQMVVEIRNLAGDEAPRYVWFAANHTPFAVKVVEDDADSNGVVELAVLSTRNSDGRMLVEVKNAFGATNPKALWYMAGNTPVDLEVVPDKDANGIPEIAVLSSRNSNGRIVTELKNASGASLPSAVWFMPGNTAIDLVAVDDKDGNGIPEVAVLSSRISDGSNVVEIKNAAGVTSPTAVWFIAGNTAKRVAQTHDVDNNGVPEVAVLSVRDSDGRIVVEVKNVIGAVNANAMWYSPGFTARGLATIDDSDSNGIEEALVLMIRDSDGRILVEGRNASGSPTAKQYWFSP